MSRMNPANKIDSYIYNEPASIFYEYAIINLNYEMEKNLNRIRLHIK